uniref:[histone H3]-trimethyl-L-lysine(4) demethylase n=4 Tax=Mesocestoides corti TaxID=53468 RepID=A0A5K3EJI0_MESCO
MAETTTFKFIPPPEAPVFYPTFKEFEDPLLYLEKIRPIGQETGICKIIPPKGWNPPFAVDVNTFKFTPRIQRLYELEAHSRLKLDFISKLYQFFRLQGTEKLRIPSVGGRYLDIYWLHKHVMKEGGYEKVTLRKLWPQIAENLGYPGSKFAPSMKTNYEKLLLQYELVVSAHRANAASEGKTLANISEHSPSSKRARLQSQSLQTIDYSANKELKNLQFFGAGPKTAVALTDPSASVRPKQNDPTNYLCRVCGFDNNETHLLICSTPSCQACYHTYCLSPPLPSVPHYQWKCPECVRVICSQPMDLYGFPQSDKSYTLHEFGIRADTFKAKYFRQEPSSVPCAVVEQEFWRILQEYTEDVVVEYGADVHASDQGSGFPTELQLARSPHLFPTPEQRRQALAYAQSPWNLNNLPVYGNSVLRFIKGNVDGMKVPWCYVGMVFSTFCWHIEDHWSCSINFNHWGEPKTWYGVSSRNAELFEKAMRKQASELFDLSPDLLHHITTIMNPNLLQAEGVPIYRTDQHCGEFVVTFPRAYHAGFNQGFNFAEAVNVCPPAWLPMGRACVEHYAEMRRQCVFSNDELLFCLAEVIAGKREMRDCATYTELAAAQFRDPDSVCRTGFEAADLRVIHDEFALVVAREAQLRRRLVLECGRSVRFRLDAMSDDEDERICALCQTTLFFSAIACPCKLPPTVAQTSSLRKQPKGKRRGSSESETGASAGPAAPSCADGRPSRAFMVCLQHAESVCEKCDLSACTLYFTYSLEELEETLAALAARMTAYEAWRREFGGLFLGSSKPPETKAEEDTKTKVDLGTFEMQLKDAQLFGYHTDQLYKRANSYLENLKDLLRVCDRAADFVMGRLDMEKDPEALEQLEFQLKLPAETVKSGGGGKVLTHVLHQSIDLRHPCEVDFVRLLEAVDAEDAAGPVTLEGIESIATVRGVFRTTLPEWRAEAKEAVANRAGFASILSHAQVKPEAGQTPPKVQQTLAALIDKLRTQCPGWCVHMEEFKLLCLIEEVCRWLMASMEYTGREGRSAWTLAGLRSHLAWGEPLTTRIALADVSSNLEAAAGVGPSSLRLVGNRQLRGPTNPDRGRTKPLPAHLNVVSAAHPLIRQLRARLHTTIGIISQALVDADAILAALSESIQDLHLTEPISRSSNSPVVESIAKLQRLGIASLGDCDVVKTSDPALKDCLVSLRDHAVCSCSPRFAETVNSSAVDLQLDEARLIYWWCAQVNGFLAHEGSPCPARPDAWLSRLSDLIAVERFVFGCARDADQKLAPLPELDQYRSDFRAYCEAHLAGLHEVASHFVDCTLVLPVDEFNAVLLASILPPLDDANSLRLHEAALKQDFEYIQQFLGSQTQVYAAKVEAILASATPEHLCPDCCARLVLAKADVELQGGCLLCGFIPMIPHERPQPTDSEEEFRLLEQISSDADPHAKQAAVASTSLVNAAKICISDLVRRRSEWIKQIGILLEANPRTTAELLSKQHGICIDQLPNALKAICSTVSTTSSPAPSSSSQSSIRSLLIGGYVLSAGSPLSTACLNLIGGFLL